MTNLMVEVHLLFRGSLPQEPLDDECLGLNLQPQTRSDLRSAPLSWHYSHQSFPE